VIKIFIKNLNFFRSIEKYEKKNTFLRQKLSVGSFHVKKSEQNVFVSLFISFLFTILIFDDGIEGPFHSHCILISKLQYYNIITINIIIVIIL